MHTYSTTLSRLSGDIQAVLSKNDRQREAVKVRHCYGFKQCHSPYCIKCVSRRAFAQRKHLLAVLPKLLELDHSHQVWLITGAAADNPDVKTAARACVSGMRRLFKHPRLRNRVIAYFSVLEVAHKHGRQHPCAHVHALTVTKPIDNGKYRISRRDWVHIWEDVCPQHRKPLSLPRRRRKEASAKIHASLDIRRVPRTADDLNRVLRYCTKAARWSRVAQDYHQLLVPDPRVFLGRIAALKGIPRFFGPLHKGKRTTIARPCIAATA